MGLEQIRTFLPQFTQIFFFLGFLWSEQKYLETMQVGGRIVVDVRPMVSYTVYLLGGDAVLGHKYTH